MVIRGTKLIGRAVIAAGSGKRLGSVGDVLLDSDGGKLVGLVVRRGWLHDESVLPASELQALGGDAVVSRSADLVGAKQWRERHRSHVARESDPVHDGRDLAASRG
jgi:uncharacterized protein YrrD